MSKFEKSKRMQKSARQLKDEVSENEEDEVINRFVEEEREPGFSFLKSIYNDDEKSKSDNEQFLNKDQMRKTSSKFSSVSNSEAGK